MAIEIKHPGRVRRYLKRYYGDEAYFSNGKIKKKYILMAIRRIMERPPSKRNESLLKALRLALKLKEWAKERQ